MRQPRSQITNQIAVATAAVFALVAISGMGDAAVMLAGFIPERIGSPGLLDQLGLGVPAVPVWLTPITATLLHGGWLHLGFNMMMLVFCGRQVEAVLGPRLLLLLYVIGAYCAALGQWLLGPDVSVPMIGASGAISAIIGAYALLYSNQQVRAIGPFSSHVVRMLWLGAVWIVLQGMIALAGLGGMNVGQGDGFALSQIAVGAHIGGFIAGMVLTRPLLRWRFRGTHPS